jgi:hypothetical protein
MFVAFCWQIAPIGPVLPVFPTHKSFAVNKVPHDCHLHTVEVAGSNPAAPTNKANKIKYLRIIRWRPISATRHPYVIEVFGGAWEAYFGSVAMFTVACVSLRLLFAYTLSMSRYDRASHKVYMYFFKREGWEVQFLESDLKTLLPRKFTFADGEKIRELAKRGEAQGDSESRQMLENGIEKGRGGVYLRLTPDQYARLRRPRGTPKRKFESLGLRAAVLTPGG